MTAYPKRLIEVDLPIKRISAHARREKSIRHGHISTLHTWWARRPLAACRAVLCASLWPDPADPLCPTSFQEAARSAMATWARQEPSLWSDDSCQRFNALRVDPAPLQDGLKLRAALLDFIADFANWDNSTRQPYLDTCRTLMRAAHEALSGEPGTKPLVVDLFAGGGSIPLEALRVGADAFASDINPVAVLLNKIVLEYIPRYGQRLADGVRKWGARVKQLAEQELAAFYPRDPDGAIPIAYLWSRTITCEGPGCGAEVPLIRSPWLSKRLGHSMVIKIVPDTHQKRCDFTLVSNPKKQDIGTGTVRRGAATCPICGYTTSVVSVRSQLKHRRGGADDARLLAVVTSRPGESGRFYRLPSPLDEIAVQKAREELQHRKQSRRGDLTYVPDEPLDVRGIRHTWVMTYGMESWSDYFTPRQALALGTLAELTRAAPMEMQGSIEPGLQEAIQTCLAITVNRQVDKASSLGRWDTTRENSQATFSRQALPMVWDFNEVNPFSGSSGDWDTALDWVVRVIENVRLSVGAIGGACQASATDSPLPDESVSAVVTDPPYYDAVPYSYLSDFFYVWLRRTIAGIEPILMDQPAVPKDEEIVVDRPHRLSSSIKNDEFYESELTKAFAEARRILRVDGIATIVFASKTTSSWEAFLQAVISAGWTVTGAWAIDTEMEARVAAQGQARLASSIHLVCRPRQRIGESGTGHSIGDWREVLAQLPGRIHEWLPRLVAEGVVGADAIFACLGPALEIFSRYDCVEKASGEQVTLKDFLEHVWATVAHEALSMIFSGADVAGFEPDARLTAIWLWTLTKSGTPVPDAPDEPGDEEDDTDEDPASSTRTATYSLEYDAARKIAQALGAQLDRMSRIVEVKGDMARLLTVGERERFLFPSHEDSTSVKLREVPRQLSLFPTEEIHGAGATIRPDDRSLVLLAGETTLDRLHQSMLLFARNRPEGLRHLLVEEGVGNDPRFWRLAQALSALYPAGSEEKRWVDGVPARKKSLGF